MIDMGFLVDSQEGVGKGGSWGCVRTLIRRKQVDSARVKSGGQQLAKELSVPHLIAIGNFLGFLFLLLILFYLIVAFLYLFSSIYIFLLFYAFISYS